MPGVFPALPGAARTLPSLAGGRMQRSKPKPVFLVLLGAANALRALQLSRLCPPNPAPFTSPGAGRLGQTKAMHPSPEKVDLGWGDTPKNLQQPQTAHSQSPQRQDPALPKPCREFSTSSMGNGVVAVARVGWEQRAKSWRKWPEEKRREQEAGGGSRRVLTGCEPWQSSSRRGCPSRGFPSLSLGGLWKEKEQGLCEDTPNTDSHPKATPASPPDPGDGKALGRQVLGWPSSVLVRGQSCPSSPHCPRVSLPALPSSCHPTKQPKSINPWSTRRPVPRTAPH